MNDIMSCGICLCNPNLATVGTCALNIAPSVNVCGGGIGTASCGMPQVTVSAARSNPILWVIVGGGLLYLLARGRRG